MPAYLIVRAEAAASDRADFDHWYATEHLPDAVLAFGAARAWRGWSRLDTGVHYAFYEFVDAAQAEAIMTSDAIKRLIAEFDRVWGKRVTRSRDLVVSAQELALEELRA
jgi:hypothetical protein